MKLSPKLPKEHISRLKDLLKEFYIKYLYKGSTVLGIEEVGEIEIGAYPQENTYIPARDTKSQKTNFSEKL